MGEGVGTEFGKILHWEGGALGAGGFNELLEGDLHLNLEGSEPGFNVALAFNVLA